jgi:hypothetical protein
MSPSSFTIPISLGSCCRNFNFSISALKYALTIQGGINPRKQYKKTTQKQTKRENIKEGHQVLKRQKKAKRPKGQNKQTKQIIITQEIKYKVIYKKITNNKITESKF